jgi:hypothetical protein
MKERIIKMTSEDLYNEFVFWKDKERITYDIIILKLTCRVNNLSILCNCIQDQLNYDINTFTSFIFL